MPEVGRLILKIGGSILFPEEFEPNEFSEKIKQLSDGIRGVWEDSPQTKIVIIIGGGSWAKRYIRFAEKIGVDGFTRDIYGINISRMNADISRFLLTKYLNKQIAPDIPKTPEEADKLLHQYKIVLMGGTYPGQSTIGTAALVAERVGADLFIILTDVKGIYKSDPKKDPFAKKFDKISIKELKEIVLEQEAKPGTYKLIDLVAAKILERAKIPTIVIGCDNLTCIREIVENYRKEKLEQIYEFGTLITY